MRRYSDAVTFKLFRSCCVCSKGDAIIAAPSVHQVRGSKDCFFNDEDSAKIYVWKRGSPGLVETIAAPTLNSQIVQLVAHPVHCSVVAITSSGGLFVKGMPSDRVEWKGSWFPPNYVELPANAEFLEAEDEFDQELPIAREQRRAREREALYRMPIDVVGGGTPRSRCILPAKVQREEEQPEEESHADTSLALSTFAEDAVLRVGQQAGG